MCKAVLSTLYPGSPSIDILHNYRMHYQNWETDNGTIQSLSDFSSFTCIHECMCVCVHVHMCT